MPRRAGIVSLVLTLVVGACSGTASSAPIAQTHPTPLPSGLTLSCTDHHLSTRTMGPLEDGQYVHYVCQDGKVSSWWIDRNSAMEDAPPR